MERRRSTTASGGDRDEAADQRGGHLKRQREDEGASMKKKKGDVEEDEAKLAKRKKVEKAPVIPGRLFVGGLPHNITPEAIQQLLASFDTKAERIEINPKHLPILGTSFAFVDVVPADKAITCVNKLNRTKWKGQALRVEPAKQSKLTRIVAEMKANEEEAKTAADNTAPVVSEEKDKKDKAKEGKRVGPWKRGKAGRLLPVLTLEKKNGRGTFIHDPAKMKHNITIFPSATLESASVPLSSLTYFYEETDKPTPTVSRSRPTDDSDGESDETGSVPIRPPSPRPDNDQVAVTLGKERELSLSIIDSLLSTPPGSPVRFSEDEDEDGYDGDTLNDMEEACGLHDEYKVEWEARKRSQNPRPGARKNNDTPQKPKAEIVSSQAKEEKEEEVEKEKQKLAQAQAQAQAEMERRERDERERERKEKEEKAKEKAKEQLKRKREESAKQEEETRAKARDTAKPEIDQQPPAAAKPQTKAKKTTKRVEKEPELEAKQELKQSEPVEKPPVSADALPTGEEAEKATTDPSTTESDGQAGLKVGAKGWWTSMLSGATPAATAVAAPQPTFSLFSILPTVAPEASPVATDSTQATQNRKPAGGNKPQRRNTKGDPAIASALQALKAKSTAKTSAASPTTAASPAPPKPAPKRFFDDDSASSDSAATAFVRPSDWKAEAQDWFHSRQALTKDYKNKVKTARKRQRVTTAEPS